MGRFFLSPRAKRRKKRTTWRQRGTTEGEGEGPRGGQGKCQTGLSFGAQPCCPEGPSRREAEWSLSPLGVEKRRAAKRHRGSSFSPCRIRQLELGRKTAGQIWPLKLMRISIQPAPRGVSNVANAAGVTYRQSVGLVSSLFGHRS